MILFSSLPLLPVFGLLAFLYFPQNFGLAGE
jgi:hypothetical protein